MASVWEDTGPRMPPVIATDVVTRELSDHPNANSGVGNQLKNGRFRLNPTNKCTDIIC